MNLKKVHHIAIIGSNYEQSKRFYVDLLGFSIIRENYRPERDDYKIDLQLDEMELELFIIKNCPKRPSYPEAYGLRHLAFAVDSVDNTVRVILSILVDTFISKISFPMQPGPEIGSISDA